MAEAIKIIRVFIGSPGGLEPERQAAKRIVDEINQNHGEHWGCQIKLVGWEATLPGYNRAQSLINQDLDKCDYFTGMLWNHWGSKPDDGDTKYSSGFEEEFERAKGRVEKGLMKDIALFFKVIPDVQISDPGTSVKQVLAFREKCVKQRKPLFKEFKEVADFGPLFRAKIEEIGWLEYNATRERAKDASDPEQPATTDKEVPEIADGGQGLIGVSSINFVAELLKRPSDWEATNAFDVARFRLIALSTSRFGNDELYLGNHDSNLLFAKRKEFEFDEKENRALIDAGVVAFHHQNAPLWGWMSAPINADDPFGRVKILAAVGNEQEIANAIRILQCAGQGTPEIDEIFDRARVLRIWLLGDSTDKTFNAALSFLKTNGDADDLAIIDTFVDQVSANRKSALAAMIVAMLAAMDLSKAFDKLIEYDPDTMDTNDALALFAHPESVSTAVAENCLKLKSEIVRRAAAELLHSRQSIDAVTAEELLTDTDLEVRLLGVENLLRHEKPLQEDAVKKLLIRQQSNAILGLGYGNSGATDDTYYKKYQRNRLSQLSYDDLRKKVEASSVFDHLEVATLSEKYTKRYLAEMRVNLGDGFKNYFDGRLARLAPLYKGDPSGLSQLTKLEKYLRKGLTSKILTALCAYADIADLNLVRKTVDKYEVDFSKAVLEFLGRFGDWSDRSRILAFNDRYADYSFLSLASDERAEPVASALYSVGKKRLADLLGMEIDTRVRRALIAEFSQKDILGLSDDILIGQLNSTDDQFRKILALKCAVSLSQTRIRKLLDKYIGQNGQRYYNSIHWLDLGASMPRRVVKVIGKFESQRRG